MLAGKLQLLYLTAIAELESLRKLREWTRL